MDDFGPTLPANDSAAGGEITLTGDAVRGITFNDFQARAVAQLPTTVRLGRRPPKARPQALRLEAYAELLAAVELPESVDWYTKAAESIARMYLNDRYGDCVFAGKAHMLGGWSANDPDSGGVVLATDKEISDQYFAYTGGRDNGANIAEVMNLMKSPGFLAGGKRYRVKGWVAADPRSKDVVKAGLALFGPGAIGFNLPQTWTSSAVWDVTSSRIVGGHDVAPFGYGRQTVVNTTADGVIVSSWGRLYLITWPAFTSGRYVDEMYFAVPEGIWFGADGKAPNGGDVSVLLADLEKFGGGDIPPLPPLVPPPAPPPAPPPVGPPPPPPPPAPVVMDVVGQTAGFSFTFNTGGLFGSDRTVTVPPVPVTGTARPRSAVPSLGGPNWGRLLSILRAAWAKGGPAAELAAKLYLDYRRQDWAAVARDLRELAALLGVDVPSFEVRGIAADGGNP